MIGNKAVEFKILSFWGEREACRESKERFTLGAWGCRLWPGTNLGLDLGGAGSLRAGVESCKL